MFIWLPTFGERVADLSSGRANLLLSVFLVAYIPGRLVYTGIAERVGYSTLVIVLETLTVPVFFLTFFVAEGMETFVGVAVLGALVSGVFPTLVAFATEAAPEYSAPVNAIALGTGATSLAVVPLAIGVVSEDFGIRVAMWIPLLLAVAVAPIVLLARRIDPNV
jgi:fucose permease